VKAMILDSPGGLDRLRLVERPRPEPAPGEVLLRVHANALNFHDYVVAAGMMAVADGRVPMSDAAGEVAAVGDGVTGLQPGDRVVSVFYPRWLDGEGTHETTAGCIPGETHDGYGREYAAVPAEWVTKAPPGYSHVEAATLSCAGLTAWRGVVTEARIRPGDVVLTQGTGGVSIFALQFARAAGATVIATSSSEEKLEKLRALGADHVINYRETPDWGRRAKALTDGRGVDLVVEIGGASTMAQSIAACRMNGAISLIGVRAGMEGAFPLAQAFLSQLTIKGIRVGSRAHQQEMIRGVAANGIKPVIDSVHPLEALADAYRRQEAQQHFGKICVEI
jgi:NADPH:quinone reductase-like Zn-dependent oxidoreductase